MATSVRTHLDFLSASEIRNALIHPVTENPATPVTAQICYRSDTGYLQVYDGAAWNIFVDKDYVDAIDAVTPPVSSTDNAVVRFDGVTGDVIQDSTVSIDDSGSINLVDGQEYKINATSVLSSSTLGSGVTTSSLTTVGTVTTGNVDAVVSAASDTTAGKVELATVAETEARSSTTLAVTPAGLGSFLNQYNATFSSQTTQTITAATHGLTTVLGVIVQDDDGTVYGNPLIDVTINKSTQEVIWASTSTAFNGRVVIIGI